MKDEFVNNNYWSRQVESRFEETSTAMHIWPVQFNDGTNASIDIKTKLSCLFSQNTYSGNMSNFNDLRQLMKGVMITIALIAAPHS